MNKNIRLCHSVWTKPMQGKRWDISGQLEANLWLFALSVAHAKKLGAEIVLHTDSLGKELYGFLPYDKVYLTLDKLNVHERFWAAGKIHAQEAEPLHSIHIDGDVFLKKQAIMDLISDMDSDLIIQIIEGDSTPSCLGTCYQGNMDFVLSALRGNIPHEFNINQDSAHNCGLVKFNNPDLKKRYIEGYKEMLNNCSNDQSFVKRLTVDNNICPDLIIEQWWLKSLTDYYKHNVKTVQPGWGCDNAGEALRLGYEHLIGKSKYDKIHYVRFSLLEIDPDLYFAVDKKLILMSKQ